MPIPIVIAGAGGHAREICSYLAGHPDFELLGVLDDCKPCGPFERTGVLGTIECLPALAHSHPGLRFITALGDNRLRASMVRRIATLGAPIAAATVIARLAYFGPPGGPVQDIGEGTLLAPGVIVTTRVKIGRHCILNLKVSVSHDCEISDFVNLNPAVTLCGGVSIGEGASIGAGATVIDKVSIGAWSTIGAGAVVIRDIPAHVTAVGVPAAILQQPRERKIG